MSDDLVDHDDEQGASDLAAARGSDPGRSAARSNARPSRWRARLTALTLGALAALLATNLVLERVFPVRRMIFQLDPELLHSTRASSSRLLVMDRQVGGARVPIRIDARGFRGPGLELREG